MTVLCPLHVGGGYDNPANDKMRLNVGYMERDRPKRKSPT